MSDFFREPTSPRARKRYVCEACGWFIPQGEQHKAQTGVYDGRAFSNRFHDECFEALCLDEFASEGFVTGDYPVPDRFKAEAEAYWAEKSAATQEKQHG